MERETEGERGREGVMGEGEREGEGEGEGEGKEGWEGGRKGERTLQWAD